MGKLLTKLGAIDKRNGITKDHHLSIEDQQSYVDTQVEEMKKIIHRNRVDILINESLKCETKAEQAARDQKVRELEASVEQLVDACTVLTKLSNEL